MRGYVFPVIWLDKIRRSLADSSKINSCAYLCRRKYVRSLVWSSELILIQFEPYRLWTRRKIAPRYRLFNLTWSIMVGCCLFVFVVVVVVVCFVYSCMAVFLKIESSSVKLWELKSFILQTYCVWFLCDAKVLMIIFRFGY